MTRQRGPAFPSSLSDRKLTHYQGLRCWRASPILGPVPILLRLRAAIARAADRRGMAFSLILGCAGLGYAVLAAALGLILVVVVWARAEARN